MILQVATPPARVVELPVSQLALIEVVPSLKVTLPVGVPAEPLTVARYVTWSPVSDGLAELVSTVVAVASGLTVWETELESLLV